MESEEIAASLRISGQDVPLKEPSCKKCAHLPVCKIFPATLQMLAEKFPDIETAPFKPDELAKICRYYVDLPKFSTDPLTV